MTFSFPTTPQPSYSVKKKSKPNIRSVRFADGFEQRIFFGLAQHQNPKIFNFNWNNITETESDALELFLDARAEDGKSFTYQPLGEAASMKFKCEEWTKTIDFPNRATISATFIQVFEP